MRKLLLGAVAGAGLIAPAMAADMPVKAPPQVAAAVYSWTGFYIGAHAGYGWNDNASTILDGGVTFPAGFVIATEPKGGLFGGQVGFNLQSGPVVYGVEVDGAVATLTDTTRSQSPLIAGRYNDSRRDIDWLVTAAGRLGYAVNNWLWFAKGGYAWAKHTAYSETFSPAGAVLVTNVADDVRGGWLVGGGVEWGLAANWSLKVEYNYIDFGSKNISSTQTVVGGAVTAVPRDVDSHMQIVKAGLNFRWGGSDAVVARY
jgi:outer membrane immunogenic protein